MQALALDLDTQVVSKLRSVNLSHKLLGNYPWEYVCH